MFRVLSVQLFLAGLSVAELVEIEYASSADNTKQKALFYDPKPGKPVPLIVALHTWSGDYRQRHYKQIEEWVKEKGWVLIHPDFRGPAKRPEATGSELVVKDIVSAIEYAKKTSRIDEKAIFWLSGDQACIKSKLPVVIKLASEPSRFMV